jgi:hypothetical protein
MKLADELRTNMNINNIRHQDLYEEFKKLSHRSNLSFSEYLDLFQTIEYNTCELMMLAQLVGADVTLVINWNRKKKRNAFIKFITAPQRWLKRASF